MCEPATAVAVGSALAGTALQYRGMQEASNAEADAIRAETGRQTRLADASRARVDQALSGVSRQSLDAETERATADRTVELRAAGRDLPNAGAYLPGQDSAPQIVRDEVDRRRALTEAFLDSNATNRARLGGWGDALFGGNIGIGRSAQDVATNAGFARGSASVLPLEQRGAMARGANTRMLGDLTVLGGTMAAPYAGKGWASLFGAPVTGMRTDAAGRILGGV